MWMHGIVKCCKSVLESWISKCGVGNKIGNGRGRIFGDFRWIGPKLTLSLLHAYHLRSLTMGRDGYVQGSSEPKECHPELELGMGQVISIIRYISTCKKVWFRPQKQGLLQRNEHQKTRITQNNQKLQNLVLGPNHPTSYIILIAIRFCASLAKKFLSLPNHAMNSPRVRLLCVLLSATLPTQGDVPAPFHHHRDG